MRQPWVRTLKGLPKMSCLMNVAFTVASALSIIRDSSSHSRSSKLTLTWWLHLLATGGRPPLQNRFVIKMWIKWWCIAEPLPAAGLNMGCPTSEDSLHIARLLRWNSRFPETFWVSQKTPCYVRVYILHIMKQEVESLMAARFAIRGVRKSYSSPFHASGGHWIPSVLI